MCGIAGLSGPDSPVLEALEKMASRMRLRGPDGEGFISRGRAGLAHTRLAIIDLEGGRQPILNEDESLAIVCNGEIYDFEELRRELLAKGHQFRTHSDSEVILHLYEEMGEACLGRLKGMFAFAILHLDSGRIFLGRDRYGKKPLFYTVRDGRFAFASGPQALLALDWVDSSLDEENWAIYLDQGYLPTPRSAWSAIRKLPAGHRAVWDKGELKIDSWWQYRIRGDFPGDFAEAAAETRRLVELAVQRRLVAEVPLGCFLSGGVDSSIIAGVASKLKPGLKTFSIGFPEAKFDERQYAAEVARHLGTEHQFLEVDPGSFGDFAAIVERYEEPFADASMIPTSLLCRFAREQVTVALSGDGADELFGGYERYSAMNLLGRFDAVPRGLRRGLRKSAEFLLPPKTEERTRLGRIRRVAGLLDLEGRERWCRVLNRSEPALVAGLLRPELQERQIPLIHHIGALARPEIGPDAWGENDVRAYMLDDILVKVDRASMGYSLEARAPFLDADLAEFAMSIPFAFRQRGRRRKLLLEAAFRRDLPASVFDRSKMGFGVPLARWFRGPWLSESRQLLLDSPFLRQRCREGALEGLLRDHVEQRCDAGALLFSLCSLALWARQQAP
ncbi:MAG: Asparagine synthetase 1 [Verrucomicrobiota bacterium]|jgi:asparagine synthase (glutamine-hydrolysing)